MRPKTTKKIDETSFLWIKNTAKVLSSTKHNQVPEVPEEIGLMLTYKCNLRCKHCFQWNETGHFNTFPEDKKSLSIDIEVIRRIIHDTHENASRIYLWGGEPFLYEHWDELIELLISSPRVVTVCTNGLTLKHKLGSLMKLPVPPNILLSIDGLAEAHDSVRGKGGFKRLQENLHVLQHETKSGNFKGKVSVNCMVTNENIVGLFDFAAYCEELGIIDTLFFCLPWFISNETASDMSRYFRDKFSWIGFEQYEMASWHSFNYKISPENIAPLKDQIGKLNSRTWDMRIRFRPDIKIGELDKYLKDEPVEVEHKNLCFASQTRLDILADGSVSSCKHFPEFAMGNINHASFKEIWNGNSFNKTRKIFADGLTPVCRKCILLYQNGK